ncbi:NAD(P)/FAD-dependent oxidoreductase [Chthonobacter rhizosphaerae]|uniref:NAD(P)/FAD-dependent oxidoreductase n=1 Tax=Chthonobacter rhizosphaerae TaxID=2735553 RepID=UPI0015EF35EC|nr:FAD-binding oxidoreductase [Chthonobacter rhizosphaerae]
MGPPLDPVPSDDTLPASADVVVVGGGIVGVATTLALAERGVDVLLLEKGVIAGEQSSRNWGWIRVMGRDLREVPLMLEAQRLWDALAPRLDTDIGYRRTGILYVSATEREVANRDAWVAAARPFGVTSRQIGADAALALMPGLALRPLGALHTPSDARAEPQKAAPALARLARGLGARIVTGCAVRGFDRSAGRIAGVVTERGVVRTSAVVVAGGAWSRLILKGVGVALPQLKVRNSVARTRPVPAGPDGAAALAGFAYRRRFDGGFTIADGDRNEHTLVPDSVRFFRAFQPAFRAEGESVQLGLGRRFLDELREIRPVPLDRPGAFERTRVLDPEPDKASAARAVAAMERAFPTLGTLPVEQVWAGLIDVTPDAVPVIGPVETVPGLLVATGFSGHGFGIGPGAGRLAADLVTGAPPIVDPAPFRLSRFLDGTPVTLAPPV